MASLYELIFLLFMVISPFTGLIKPAMLINKVVFPAALGPTRQDKELRGMERKISFRISRPDNFTFKDVTVSIGSSKFILRIIRDKEGRVNGGKIGILDAKSLQVREVEVR